MDKKGLTDICKYNDDANSLLLGAAMELTAEEFNRSSSPSHGSVLGLLLHMLDVEAYFLSLCQVPPSGHEPRASRSFEELRKDWEGVVEVRQEYLAEVGEKDLQGEVQLTFGRGLTFTRSQCLLQSFISSIHHRGELSIVMTGLGHPLPTLDIILHFARQSGQEWP